MSLDHQEQSLVRGFEGVAGNEILFAHQPYVHLISFLLGNRFGLYSYSVSQSGEFSRSYLDEWQRFQEASEAWRNGDEQAYEKRGVYRMHSSPGFGYTASSVAEMEKARFTTGPAIAIVLHELWESDAERDLKRVQAHFERFGVSGFVAKGGSFPDDIDSLALILDVSDPEFLKKVKPDFLSYFVTRGSENLLKPYHMETPALQRGYCLAVYNRIKACAEQVGVSLFEGQRADAGSSALAPFADIPEQADSQAGFHLCFVLPSFEAMLPVLSPEERKTLLTGLVESLAAFEVRPVSPVPSLSYGK